ncbi:NUDIX hydrolase [Saccharomonospora viridis]|jgi:8-oxo-dGTP pyrophosphatase MutT (NUDIX family)|uniref:ADP-ribose pyrophosphatase n=1 Tax=Saccharomonospora viridis (strain ATCC 15386 / DSM 43017 / JCM 3036 / CCUG 5913 / NBRC 12207 / NCIMB 9602 / P101) TaxID=471857 RepID=C7MQN7_SACVD|nr:CoA pyrophosphatase [Saccharomonospora viridis]ACU98564.1 ADP-ribose pyrophosphatase [Saccharomonospora viridis DSM 43017]SFP62644.1 ADP-ribose pyrophosphatase YjhB, NUDIX family [Saccharomonospora viridis]
MSGPLTTPSEVPEWLRPLVESSAKVDSTAFTRVTPPPYDARRAAVLMLFGIGEHGPDVLLLRRADTLGSHAGQVAFPGGGAEEGEDPVATALREAEEETGVLPEGIHPVAVFPELYVPVSRFAVTPVLAHWHQPSPVRPVDPAETAAVARVPIAELADPANRFLVARRGGGWRGPAFTVRGLFVWGFTAGVLATLLELGGWAREWDRTDVRDLDVALAEHEARTATGRT